MPQFPSRALQLRDPECRVQNIHLNGLVADKQVNNAPDNASDGGCANRFARANNEECLVFSEIKYRIMRHDRRLSSLCTVRSSCDRTHVSQEKSRSALLDLNHERLRRNAVGYHFEKARAGFHVSRYIQLGFHQSRVANRHAAVAMRTAIENVAGNDVG